MNNSENYLATPPQITFAKFLLKILAGLGGGSIGTLIVLAIFLATSSILEGLFKATEGDTVVGPIVIFVLVFTVFLGAAVANILGALFTYFVDRDKYRHIYSTVIKIVISNVVLLFLMVPTYFLSAGISIESVVFVAALHFVISAQTSNLTLEIAANPNYGLLGVYSTSIAIILSMVVVFSVYQFAQQGTVILFIALPVIWGSIGFASSVVDGIYGFITSSWGVDFAATDTGYGKDYSTKIAEQEQVQQQEQIENKDVSGSEFLKKN